MKNRLLSAFSEGFKNSFRLSASLVASVAATITTFAHHNPADLPEASDNQKISRKPRKR